MIERPIEIDTSGIQNGLQELLPPKREGHCKTLPKIKGNIPVSNIIFLSWRVTAMGLLTSSSASTS